MSYAGSDGAAIPAFVAAGAAGIVSAGFAPGMATPGEGYYVGLDMESMLHPQTLLAYEINGDNIVLRYLTRNKCAFRLNRLQPSKPHQVTAIVVAGGKM